MVAEAMPWGRVTAAFASWLSGQATVVGTVNARFRDDRGLPQATAMRVGGTDAACQMQVDVWGATESEAEAAAAEVATTAEQLAGTQVLGVHLKGAQVQGIRSQRDDVHPRFVCDIVLTTAS